MYISRIIEKSIKERLLKKNRIIILYGARQTGKTTLANTIIGQIRRKTLKINGDIPDYANLFTTMDFAALRGMVANYEIMFIDEAQKLPNIDKVLKILHDEFPGLKILVTGSSSLDLSSKITEPLTGRKSEYLLFPFSFEEIKSDNPIENNALASEMMIYGSYPEVYTEKNYHDKQEIILEISRSYLFKDLLSLAQIRYPQKIVRLARMLAYQIGNTVSVHELSRTLSINHETVENYLDLLEKTFVIFRLSPFESNMRKTLKKQNKFFFYDLGIRNALIENFSSLKERNDTGQLWENFIILERRKLLNNHRLLYTQHFWRTYDGAEVDLVEKIESRIQAVEIKFTKVKQSPPPSWKNMYQDIPFLSVAFNNFQNFLQNI